MTLSVASELIVVTVPSFVRVLSDLARTPDTTEADSNSSITIV